ncbi:MAG: cupin domain-containing protein [Acidobacteriota bacterium]
MTGHVQNLEGLEPEEAAALAALGFLTPSEAANVAPEAVAEMTEALALLSETVPRVPPAPAAKERLMSRVAAWQALRPLAEVRACDGAWISAGVPGVDLRPLFPDKQTGRTTMLMRMEPGASFPAHYHADDEQCYVLQGDIRWGPVAYEEGDFVVMAKHTTHPEIRSERGNLLLIIAGRNELIRA